ncbi:hypothetical protein [Methylobacterium sp. J-076]|uniref:hypothetical protein n=1 Tax=Methylobacterium sp. J-076 TaxID=2836655 RepID=UPI001FB9091D|nr:hypothetical protein [Methylobacterium sp. J-076]MCJ2015099.1 hypothetical protein [Methylobacterium sp. J-076]
MSGVLDRLRGLIAEPAPAPEAAGGAPSHEPGTRRDREATPAERQIAEAIAQKMLHGWLQNRHQTLMPLSVNLALLTPEARGRIARFAALTATAGPGDGAAARLRSWIAATGGDADTLAAYEAALLRPPALGPTLAGVGSPDCAGLAYVLALVAAQEDGGDGAGYAFARYVAERVGLPTAARRSAERRYGR